ncbi:MAG TPA: hypothetical protein VGD89_04380 [Flavipsychrobacter sp.]
MNTRLFKYAEVFWSLRLMFRHYAGHLTFNKAMFKRCRQYITLYRALLLCTLVPGIIISLFSREFRNMFVMIWGGFAALTYLVESALFIFQFTRRENFYVELIMLPLTVAGLLIVM